MSFVSVLVFVSLELVEKSFTSCVLNRVCVPLTVGRDKSSFYGVHVHANEEKN